MTSTSAAARWIIYNPTPSSRSSTTIKTVRPTPDIILQGIMIVVVIFVIIVLNRGSYTTFTTASSSMGVIQLTSPGRRTRRSRRYLNVSFMLLLLFVILVMLGSTNRSHLSTTTRYLLFYPGSLVRRRIKARTRRIAIAILLFLLFAFGTGSMQDFPSLRLEFGQSYIRVYYAVSVVIEGVIVVVFIIEFGRRIVESMLRCEFGWTVRMLSRSIVMAIIIFVIFGAVRFSSRTADGSSRGRHDDDGRDRSCVLVI
eukprot:scaffold5305_cov30-Cyclotella_meneghiniana.AAC.5